MIDGRRSRTLLGALLTFALVSVGAPVVAQAEGPVAARATAENQAREAFLRGVELVRAERWSEALAEFDRSVADRPHPVTFFNMALCHRALGRPVRAVFALERALAEEGSGESGRLAEDKVGEARRLLSELRGQRAFVVLTLTDTDSALSVDGQPVERFGETAVPSLVPGPPTLLARGKVRLALDPGRHALRVTRQGHDPWAHEAVFSPGETRDLTAELRLLPGILAVRATVPGATLTLDGTPTGKLPSLLERPHGPHRVEVAKAGYTPFVTEVVLQPGVRADVLAELRPEKVPLTKKWWFYAGIGVAVAAAGVTTYALTRPTEKADGGSLGWVVRP
jgi:hypothetical protein